jgi:hypothetical protein
MWFSSIFWINNKEAQNIKHSATNRMIVQALLSSFYLLLQELLPLQPAEQGEKN